MHTFIAKFLISYDICKKFAGNRVNNKGNIRHRGVVPTCSALEVIALSLAAEASGFDSENYLFKRLEESEVKIPDLIIRRQFNSRRKSTTELAESIRKNIAERIDGGENVFVTDCTGTNTR